MKKKLILTTAFLISLLPMLLNQYGGMRGVQEISGLMNLANPIGTVALVLYLMGVWVSFFKHPHTNKALCILGVVGMVVSEIYTFLTWHVLTITGALSLQHSLQLAFPEFYLGLAVSVLMVIVYFILNKKFED